MTKQGRYYDETPYTLEQKLSENIWWLLELSQRLDIDILTEMENFLSDKEKQLNLGLGSSLLIKNQCLETMK